VKNYLYSIILEISATSDTTLPATTGHQAHALFLDLIQHVDPALATRLHNQENYRPFTVSPLRGAIEKDTKLFLRTGHVYSLRVTMLDGGSLLHFPRYTQSLANHRTSQIFTLCGRWL
jgi:CRISPR-associated endoribonuclease Cas6